MALRYGLIGCGRISTNHLEAAWNNGLEIVALCDVDPKASAGRVALLAQWANDCGADSADRARQAEPRCYADHHTMLQEEKLDLIAICASSGMHASLALDCIDAGVNLIIEKPIALSLMDADEIIRRSNERNVKVCACHQNRFNRSIQAIRDALEAGRFGKLLYGTAHIRWNRGSSYYEQAPWRGTWEHDGGVLMNQGIHNIDLLRWMMGDEVTEVFAYTDRLAHDYLEAEDLGLALVRFANGSYGVIEGTTDVYPVNLEETLYIFGSKGTVKAGGTSVNTLEHWMFADDRDDPERVMAEANEQPRNIYGFGHMPLYADVIQAIQDDRQPSVDALAGRRALELVLAIYQSARDGVPVSLPLRDFSTLDMTGSFL